MSQKKLFSRGNSSSEGSKPVKRVDGQVPNSPVHLIDEGEMVGVSSVKGRSSNYSYAPCVTDEDGMRLRPAFSYIEWYRFRQRSYPNEDEDGVRVEFQQCITVIADKLGFLSRHRAGLLERCSRADAAHGQLVRELEEKKELLKSLYTKRHLEKQANKEKISFGCFEVHELAAFVLKSAGHYEAINRNCSNYFLSKESVARFSEQHPGRPTYIIGQIVYIEQQIMKPPISLRAEHSDEIETLNADSSSSSRSPYSGAASNPFIQILPDPACG